MQLFNIAEGLDLPGLGWNTPRYVDVVSRAMQRVFLDRKAYMADPRFFEVPMALPDFEDVCRANRQRTP